MKIFLGSDHAGYHLKEKLKVFLGELGYDVEDQGAFSHNPQDDYPDFVLTVAKKVAESPDKNRGIVLGGSGQGEAMAANRIKGVRAAVFYGSPCLEVQPPNSVIRLSREHNDANILSLGARFLSEEEAREAVKLWLETPFSNEERHKRRIAKLD